MEFLDKYFLEPMGHYYTLPNTIVYSIVFVIVVFLVYKYLLKRMELFVPNFGIKDSKRMKFKIDKNFMLSLVPFILLGGIMRSLEDAEFYQGFMFVSPGIYVTIFFITLGSLLASVLIEKYTKKEYWKIMLVIGSVLCLYNLYQVFSFGIKNWSGVFMTLGLVGLWSLVFGLIHLKFPKHLSRVNLPILVSHLFDGSATFIALSYFSYMEQHVLPSFLIGFTGPWVMFPLKIFIVWPVLYLIDKHIEDKEFRIWLKITVLILGLALGTRDILKVGMAVA